MENYDVGPLLGTGAFAHVFKARDRRSGQRVALKIVDVNRAAQSKRQRRREEDGPVFEDIEVTKENDCSLSHSSRKGQDARQTVLEAVMREVAVHRAASSSNSHCHPNIVTFLGSFASSSNVTIVLEYCHRGDLQSYMKRVRDRRRYLTGSSDEFAGDVRGEGRCQSETFLREDEVRHALSHVLRGLAFLHSRGIAHRDIKAGNVFLCPLPSSHKADESSQSQEEDAKNVVLDIGFSLIDCTLKIGDFGLGVKMDDDDDWDEALHTVCGTPSCLAPEVALSTSADKNSTMKTKGKSADSDPNETIDLLSAERDSLLDSKKNGSKSRGHGQPADLWSTGCLLYAMLVGRYPFSSPKQTKPVHQSGEPARKTRSQRVQETIGRALRGDWSLPPSIAVSEQARALLIQLLSLEPSKRGFARSILASHAFFKTKGVLQHQRQSLQHDYSGAEIGVECQNRMSSTSLPPRPQSSRRGPNGRCIFPAKKKANGASSVKKPNHVHNTARPTNSAHAQSLLPPVALTAQSAGQNGIYRSHPMFHRRRHNDHIDTRNKGTAYAQTARFETQNHPNENSVATASKKKEQRQHIDLTEDVIPLPLGALCGEALHGEALHGEALCHVERGFSRNNGGATFPSGCNSASENIDPSSGAARVTGSTSKTKKRASNFDEASLFHFYNPLQDNDRPICAVHNENSATTAEFLNPVDALNRLPPMKHHWKEVKRKGSGEAPSKVLLHTMYILPGGKGAIVTCEDINDHGGIWMHLTGDGLRVFAGKLLRNPQPLLHRGRQQASDDSLIAEAFSRAPRDVREKYANMHFTGSAVAQEYHSPMTSTLANMSFSTGATSISARSLPLWSHKSSCKQKSLYKPLSSLLAQKNKSFLSLYRKLEVIINSVKQCTPKITLYIHSPLPEFEVGRGEPKDDCSSGECGAPEIGGLVAKTMLMENSPLPHVETTFVDGVTIRYQMSSGHAELVLPHNHGGGSFVVEFGAHTRKEDGQTTSTKLSPITTASLSASAATPFDSSADSKRAKYYSDHINLAQAAAEECLCTESGYEVTCPQELLTRSFQPRDASKTKEAVKYPIVKRIIARGRCRRSWVEVQDIKTQNWRS